MIIDWSATVTERELADILRNNPDIAVLDPVAPTRRPPIPASTDTGKLSADFQRMWQMLGGPELAQEHRFHPERRWRLDFAHLPSRTAIEINGGVWSNGRHVRGAGYLRDREKINAATLLGWKVFELGTGQVTAANVQAIIEHVTEVTK